MWTPSCHDGEERRHTAVRWNHLSLFLPRWWVHMLWPLRKCCYQAMWRHCLQCFCGILWWKYGEMQHKLMISFENKVLEGLTKISLGHIMIMVVAINIKLHKFTLTSFFLAFILVAYWLLITHYKALIMPYYTRPCSTTTRPLTT